jgi:hypothetical protein
VLDSEPVPVIAEATREGERADPSDPLFAELAAIDAVLARSEAAAPRVKRIRTSTRPEQLPGETDFSECPHK